MTREIDHLTRRRVLKSGAVVTAGVAGVTGAVSAKGNGKGKGKKGGAGFIAYGVPTDTFQVLDYLPDKSVEFATGCGKSGKLRENTGAYQVQFLDDQNNGVAKRALWVHPDGKEIVSSPDFQDFKINTQCETQNNYQPSNEEGYWVTFAPA